MQRMRRTQRIRQRGNENSFRVVSGEFKGAKLDFPGDSRTHPMGAREKLALFNIISTSGMRVLDVYAGSGALGIEALSRGAKEVLFVEKAPKVVAIIRENLRRIGLEGAENGASTKEGAVGRQVKVFAESAQKFAERGEFQGEFDYILADPPYEGFRNGSMVEKELVSLIGLLAPGGRLVLSSPADLAPVELTGLEEVTTRTYAGARITVYCKMID